MGVPAGADLRGSTYRSEAFATWLGVRGETGRDVLLRESVTHSAPVSQTPDHTLSFGPATSLICSRVVLLEQLYRAPRSWPASRPPLVVLLMFTTPAQAGTMAVRGSTDPDDHRPHVLGLRRAPRRAQRDRGRAHRRRLARHRQGRAALGLRPSRQRVRRALRPGRGRSPSAAVTATSVAGDGAVMDLALGGLGNDRRVERHERAPRSELAGDAGNDGITGGAAADRLIGGAGADVSAAAAAATRSSTRSTDVRRHARRRSGRDTVIYRERLEPVTRRPRAGAAAGASATRCAASRTSIGGAARDVLRGDDGRTRSSRSSGDARRRARRPRRRRRLQGSSGADELVGGAGDDTLVGSTAPTATTAARATTMLDRGGAADVRCGPATTSSTSRGVPGSPCTPTASACDALGRARAILRRPTGCVRWTDSRRRAQAGRRLHLSTAAGRAAATVRSRPRGVVRCTQRALPVDRSGARTPSRPSG